MGAPGGGVLGSALLVLLGQQEEGGEDPPGQPGTCGSETASCLKRWQLHHVSFPAAAARSCEPVKGRNTSAHECVGSKQRLLNSVRSGSGAKSKGKFENRETSSNGDTTKS